MKTGHKIMVWGIIVAAVIAIIAIAVPVCIYFRGEQVTEKHRTEEAEEKKLGEQRQQEFERERAKPKLHYVSVRYEDGYTILTFKNKSPVTPAAVSLFTFVISDPDTLRRIERRHPKPKEYMVERENNLDDVGFTKGYWSRDGTYGFPKDVGYHVPPNEVNDFRLAIINPKWAGERFVGTLEIEHSSDKPPHLMETYRLQDVRIDPKSRP